MKYYPCISNHIRLSRHWIHFLPTKWHMTNSPQITLSKTQVVCYII